MLLLIIFSPLVAAVVILAGAPARKTALAASIFALAITLVVLSSFKPAAHDFQNVVSFTISTEWGLQFAVGVDGLNLIMILLAALVTVAQHTQAATSSVKCMVQ